MKDTVAEVALPDGNRLMLRPFYIAEAEVVLDIYENNHYALLDLKENDVVLDIGAHIGSFTLKAARLVGNRGAVYAFEPHPGSFGILKKNIELNGYDNVYSINTALSDSEGMALLSVSEGSIAHSIVFRRSPESLNISTRTIDSVVEELNIDVSAIKIDAEGAELKVLAGGVTTLQTRPRVAVAAYHTPVQVLEISGFLEDLGYSTRMEYVKASLYRAMQDFVPIVYGY